MCWPSSAERQRMLRLPDCPACGLDAARIVTELNADRCRRFLEYSRVKYGSLLDAWLADIEPVIMACNGCGHHWYRDQPTPAQLDAMYAAGRHLLSAAVVSREPTVTMLREMRRLRRLTGKSAPSLLDYGSGYGRWARAAVRAGFAVHAYEPSVARGAEDVAEFAVVHDLAALDGMRFDVVNLEQVLEHIPDPLAALASIRKFCSSDTVLRITVPNILRCPEGAALWDEWPFNGHRPHTMAPFEHLHGFTPSSLYVLLDRSGFRHLPALDLAVQYPGLVLRNLAGRFLPQLGQTLALVSPKRS